MSVGGAFCPLLSARLVTAEDGVEAIEKIGEHPVDAEGAVW